MIIRGTDIQFKFELLHPVKDIAWITIEFKQENNPNKCLPIIKHKEDCVYSDDSNILYASLTGEETARFVDLYKAKVQFRYLHTESGQIFGNREELVTVYPASDDIIEVIPSTDDEYVILDGKVIM